MSGRRKGLRSKSDKTKARDGLVNGRKGAKAARTITLIKGGAGLNPGTKKEEVVSVITTTKGKTGAREEAGWMAGLTRAKAGY